MSWFKKVFAPQAYVAEEATKRAQEASARAQAEAERQRQEQIRAEQERMERERQAKIQGRRDQLSGMAGDEARTSLAHTMAGITTTANSRGRLYGGAKMGAESLAQGQAAAGLSNRVAQINQSTEDELGKLEAESTSRGNQRLGTAANSAAQAYQLALQKKQAEGNPLGDLGAGIGKLGGLIGGK